MGGIFATLALVGALAESEEGIFAPLNSDEARLTAGMKDGVETSRHRQARRTGWDALIRQSKEILTS